MTPQRNKTELDLEHFLPYRLSVLSNRVSQAIARIYAERFDLSITEWRVMAVLGRSAGLSANEVAERTAMDKVAVSRAVGRLIDAGQVQRDLANGDRRRSELSLSAAGRRVYAKVAPLALDLERRLLSSLSPEEQRGLDAMLGKLMTSVQDLPAVSG